jgi:BASS family bile acid:Na+ symporter
MPTPPGPEASVDPAELLKLAFQISIILTVFVFGLGASVEDILYLVRRPRMLVISLVSMFIVMPFVALVLVFVFDPPQIAKVALVALALSPVPPVFPAKVRGAGGRDSYGLGLMAVVSILSIVLVPALVEFLGALMGRPFRTGPAAVAGLVLVLVVLPLAAGMLVRAFLPRVADRVQKPFATVGKIVLTAAFLVLLVVVFPHLLAALTVGTVAAIVAFTVLGLAFGHILAGPDPNDSAVLALSSALRHPGIALVIASGNFPTLDFGAVIILYLLIGGILTGPYTKRMHQRAAARQAAVPRGPSGGVNKSGQSKASDQDT